MIKLQYINYICTMNVHAHWWIEKLHLINIIINESRYVARQKQIMEYALIIRLNKRIILWGFYVRSTFSKRAVKPFRKIADVTSLWNLFKSNNPCFLSTTIRYLLPHCYFYYTCHFLSFYSFVLDRNLLHVTIQGNIFVLQ